jgi:hypothetical protein
MLEMLGLEGVFGHKVVQNAPFSAQGTSQMTQTLADGTRISRTQTLTVHRDSQGRTRRELTLTGIGALQAQGQPKHFILVSDPVAGTLYLLNPDKKIAHQMRLPNGMGRGQRGPGNPEAGPGPGPNGPENADVQRESLGTQTINGVKAEGTRVTRTIPAGQIGNDKPIVSTVERWYSPDLQVTVTVKRSDPRFGEGSFALTNIQTKEPNASLFQVPSDYTVKQGRPGMGKGLRGRGMRQRMGGPPAGDAAAPPPDAPQPNE